VNRKLMKAMKHFTGDQRLIHLAEILKLCAEHDCTSAIFMPDELLQTDIDWLISNGYDVVHHVGTVYCGDHYIVSL